MLKRYAPVIILLAGLFLVACNSSNQDSIVVKDVWGRPSPMSTGNAAFYMAIENKGSAQDALVAASVDICSATELHMSTIDDAGVMSMHQVQQIDIPAGQTVTLEPGGQHVMCIGRQVDLASGDSVPISLSFTQAGTITVEAEIKEQ